MDKTRILVVAGLIAAVVVLIGLALVTGSVPATEDDSAGATQDEEYDLVSLIFQTSPDCTAPCWLNIRPGTATEADLDDLVDASGDRFTGLKRTSIGDAWALYWWTDTVAAIPVKVAIRDRVVHSMSLTTGAITASGGRATGSESEIGLGDVTGTLDKPGRYSARVMSTSAEGEAWIRVTLFYEEGIVIESDSVLIPSGVGAAAQTGCTIQIAPDMPVTSVHYCDTDGEFPEPHMAELYATSSPWPGWGPVDAPPACTPPATVAPFPTAVSLPQGPSALDECLAAVAAGAVLTNTHVQPQETPVAEWHGVPIMPGAIAAEESDWEEVFPASRRASYYYTIAAPPAEVWSYYLAEMPAAGWVAAGCDWFRYRAKHFPFLMFGGDSLDVYLHLVAEIDPDSGQTFVYLNHRIDAGR